MPTGTAHSTEATVVIRWQRYPVSTCVQSGPGKPVGRKPTFSGNRKWVFPRGVNQTIPITRKK